MTESSISTAVLFAAWSLVAMIGGVPAASICWAILTLIGTIMLVSSADTRDEIKRQLVARSNLDKVFSWFVMIFVLVSTYPFAQIFWGFVVLLVSAEIAIRLALKISCKSPK